MNTTSKVFVYTLAVSFVGAASFYVFTALTQRKNYKAKEVDLVAKAKTDAANIIDIDSFHIPADLKERCKTAMEELNAKINEINNPVTQ